MSDSIATRDAYGKALLELGKESNDIVVLDADLSKSTKTAMFAKEFPGRFFNMGIAEQSMMGTAAGLAACGKVPFASTFAMFATGRAFEVIRNSVAYPRLNVKIAATHAGITVGEDGATHQCIEDIAIMRAIPNMTVISPADAIETRAAVKAAAAFNGPVYIRLGRSKVPAVYDEGGYTFEWGKGLVVRDGQDAAIIATGIMVSIALEAADLLKQQGLRVRVVDIHTIKPIDEDIIINAAKDTGVVVTAEEHSIIGGLGSAVSEVLCEKCPVPIKRIGIADVFGESGSPKDLLSKYGLAADDIAKVVVQAVENK